MASPCLGFVLVPMADSGDDCRLAIGYGTKISQRNCGTTTLRWFIFLRPVVALTARARRNDRRRASVKRLSTDEVASCFRGISSKSRNMKLETTSRSAINMSVKEAATRPFLCDISQCSSLHLFCLFCFAFFPRLLFRFSSFLLILQIRLLGELAPLGFFRSSFLNAFGILGIYR